MRKRIWALALLVLPVVAHGMVSWRSTDEIVSEEARGGSGHHRGGPTTYYLREGEGVEATLWSPDLSAKPLVVSEGKTVAKTAGADGYHLMMARRVSPGQEEVALRYFYAPGKPSGHSPSELLRASKAMLEIVPAPLPREHWRYESSDTAAFVVRFDSLPLANVPLQMVTSNGTLFEAVADSAGVVRFELPGDFARVRPGREANAPAEFVLSVAHQNGETKYRTTLSADYHVNPGHWQSTAWGAASLSLGFMVGIFAVRVRPEEKKA